MCCAGRRACRATTGVQTCAKSGERGSKHPRAESAFTSFPCRPLASWCNTYFPVCRSGTQSTSPSHPAPFLPSPPLAPSPPPLCSYIAFQRAAQAEQQRTDIAEVPADIPLNMMQELMTKQQVRAGGGV